MRTVDSIMQSLDLDKRRLEQYERLSRINVEGRLNCRWEKRRETYCYYYKGANDEKERYVPVAPNSLIWKLQTKHFAKSMVRILKHNINIKSQFIEQLWPDAETEVMEQLPRAYRPNTDFKPASNRRQKKYPPPSENPYKREQLIVKTSFGLYVRSRGEAAIAEMLYGLGIEFYYEKALELRVLRDSTKMVNGELVAEQVWKRRTVYPDFTIILPDGQVYYWEHEGLSTDADYIQTNIQKQIDYTMNRIYQSHNLIVTSDGPNNEIDYEGIKRIIHGILLCKS